MIKYIKKIHWPDFKEAVKSSIFTIMVSLVLALGITGVETGINHIIALIVK